MNYYWLSFLMGNLSLFFLVLANLEWEYCMKNAKLFEAVLIAHLVVMIPRIRMMVLDQQKKSECRVNIQTETVNIRSAIKEL